MPASYICCRLLSRFFFGQKLHFQQCRYDKNGRVSLDTINVLIVNGYNSIVN